MVTCDVLNCLERSATRTRPSRVYQLYNRPSAFFIHHKAVRSFLESGRGCDFNFNL